MGYEDQIIVIYLNNKPTIVRNNKHIGHIKRGLF